MHKKRIIWADSLKGILMILVVLGHAIQAIMGSECNDNHLWNLIYSFHMPAFMAASGYFAYKLNQDVAVFGCAIYCKRRGEQLMIPFLLWSFIDIIIGCSFSWERLLNLILYPDKSFWFLWILFLISIIFVLCRWVALNLKIDELFTIFIAAALLFSLMITYNIRIFGFQFLSYYFLFYSMGYCIHRFSWMRIRNNTVLLILFCIWAFMAWFWKMHELPSWMPAIPHIPASLVQYLYRGLTAIVAILVLFSIAPKYLNGNDWINDRCRKVGVISLGIYVGFTE